MKKLKLSMLLLLIVCIFYPITGHAIIGTRLLHNSGFEEPITWRMVTSRSLHLNQWGHAAGFVLNTAGIEQVFSPAPVHSGNASLRLSKLHGNTTQLVTQWVDVRPFAGQRVVGGAWVYVPFGFETVRNAFLRPAWSAGETDILPGAGFGWVAGGTGHQVAGFGESWQPYIGIDFTIPVGTTAMRAGIFIDGFIPAVTHYWDEVQYWVNDQVTGYRAVNFSPGVLVMDTTLTETSMLDPYVIRDGDIYKMWYTSVSAGRNEISHATSSDGTTWTRLGVVLSPATDPTFSWETNRVNMGSVIKEVVAGVTTYKMWYSADGTWPDNSGRRWRIGHATSPDGINWTRYAGNPVIGTNTTVHADLFSAPGIFGPEVIKVDGIYKMWMHSERSVGHIGYSQSTNGTDWSEPVWALMAGQAGDTTAFDRAWIGHPSVFYDREAGVYHMWYSGDTAGGLHFTISHAVSEDGVFWTKNPRNPVIPRGIIGGWNDRPSRPVVIRDGTTFKMWYMVTGVNEGVLTNRLAFATGTVLSSMSYILPGAAYLNPGANVVLHLHESAASVNWVSGNNLIANIDSTAANGRIAYISALSYGVSTITATDFYGNTANAVIHVIASAPELVMKRYSDAPAGRGISTVGIGGDYASLHEASLDFNTTANTGNWTLLILNSLSESSNIVFGAPVLSNSTITIRPHPALAGVGATVTFTTTAISAVHQRGAINIGAISLIAQTPFSNAQNFIIDGSATVGGTSRDLTIRNVSVTGDQALDVINVYGPASTIVIRNLNIINNQANGTGTSLTSGVAVTGFVRADHVGFWSNNVTIENNYIVSTSSIGAQAIHFFMVGAGTPPAGQIAHRNALITRNHLVARHRGVNVDRANDIIFSRNTVEINQTSPGHISAGYNHINSLFTGTTRIHDNVFSVLSTAATAASHGIKGMNLSPAAGATDFWVYNNVITGFGFSAAPTIGTVNYRGIFAGTSPVASAYHILYNSINMPQQSTVAQVSTAAISLEVVTAPTGPRTIKNNIARMAQPGGVSVSLAAIASGGTGGSMDNNNWFTSASTGRIGTVFHATLGDWIAALGNGSDVRSQAVDPTTTTPASWISATNLAFSAGDAFPMAWGTNDLSPAPFAVTEDIVGTMRSVVRPWPGAFEGTMELTVPVELSEFLIE